MDRDAHSEVLTEFAARAALKPRVALFCLKAAVEWLSPENRIKICYRHRVPKRETVDIFYNEELARAYYSGLMKCGQGWICPLCAVRLAEVRKEQLRTAMTNGKEIVIPLMVTYTIRHNKRDRLADLIERMSKAYRTMKSQRSWMEIKAEFKVVGEIRALEVTYGDNGFHPHYHVVMWLDIALLAEYNADGQIHIDELRDYLEVRLTALWLAALEKHNLHALAGPALNVKSGWEKLDDYISKHGKILPTVEGWGIAEEMTYSARKKSRDEGLNMWDILTRVAVLRTAVWIALWKEYASATKGRSGLQWTKGLKELLGVTTDEDIEITKQEYNEGDVLLAQISIDDWRAILAAGAEGAIWDAANTGLPSEIESVLTRARVRYRETKVENLIG